jgi:hypothetical protein
VLLAVLLAAMAAMLVAGPQGARAATPQALILGDSVTPGVAPDGSGDSLEQYEAIQDGFTTTVVTGAQWDAMTASQFAAYQVVIIGDPTCDATGASFAAALSNESTWEPVVMSSGGNKVLIGTDPTFHYRFSGVPGDKVEAGGIAFAGAVAGATGAYVDLSCGYDSTGAGTPVPLLDGLSTHGTGQFTVIGEGSIGACATGVNIVANSGPTSGLTDADLSNWECSVHEAFDKFPSDYTPLALAPSTSGFPSSYCADDVETGALACGSPYIMVAGSGVVVKSNVTLTPASQTLDAGGSASLVANVSTTSGPVSGGSVVFNVDSGPNVGKTFTGTTDSSGNTTFTYSDTGGAGTDSISATYTDSHGVSQKATATVTWRKATVAPTTLTTSLSGGGSKGATITVPPGTSVTDSATLTGANVATAGGTVTYSVFSDAACTVSAGSSTTVNVANGSVPNSNPVTLSTPGTYYWVASYSGDSTNGASASSCGSETETVTAPGKAPVVDDSSNLTGSTSITDTQLTTSSANDLVVAYVSADGPASGGQSVTVSGSGLTWARVAQQNGALGDAEVWAANAGTLKKITVKVTAAKKGYGLVLTDATYKNATGIGAKGTFKSTSGAPTGTIKTTQGNSWVWAVGFDWATATKRTVGPGQTLFSQNLDAANNTYWVQSTTSPTLAAGTSVTINDTAPTSDPYDLVLVEIL